MGTYVVRIRVSRLRVLCAVLNSRLNCFLLEIYLTQQTTTMSLLAMRESGVEEREREREGEWGRGLVKMTHIIAA